MGRSAILAVFGICTATGAYASPASEEAFARGRDALQVGKYPEACAAFEDSQRLEPQPTTQFNIALCSEQLGKLATALAIYQELATTDDNPARKAKHPEKIAELMSRVARLHIALTPAAPPGLDVRINDVHVAAIADIPIDLGITRVIVRATGFAEWAGQVSAKDEKQSLPLAVQLVPDPDAARLPPHHHDDGAPGSPRKTLGLVGIIGGGAALAGGLTFGVLARGKWHDAKTVCGGTECATAADQAAGNALVDAARTRGNISTALVIAGGALVAAGVVLWVTAPAEHAVAIAPSAGPSGAGVTLSGAF